LILSNSIRAATAGLIKSLSLEMGMTGIRFNSIMPGTTETDRINELLKTRVAQNHSSLEQEIAKQTLDIPLGRMGHPAEFANAAVFLVSPAASYINGVLLAVDGGIIKGTF
jgi:3-oxoacyl-[acyl-carrier protein] reductase